MCQAEKNNENERAILELLIFGEDKAIIAQLNLPLFAEGVLALSLGAKKGINCFQVWLRGSGW